MAAIFLLITVFHNTQQDKVILQSDISRWKTNNLCEESFRWNVNEYWYSPICRKRTKLCKLSNVRIEPNELVGINELTVELTITPLILSGDLIVYSSLNSQREVYLDRIRADLGNVSRQLLWKIPVQKHAFSFSVHDYLGFCGTIKNISIYYYTCSLPKQLFVIYENRSAPSDKKILTLKGKCKDTSTQQTKTAPFAICNSTGGVKVFGKCGCKTGHIVVDGMCSQCRSGFYNDQNGSKAVCKICGKNSLSVSNRSLCLCKAGYFRSLGEKKNFSAHCFSILPSALSFSQITHHSVRVSWKRHNDKLGLNVTFVVDCDNCKYVGMIPVNGGQSFIDIIDLEENKVYSISLSAILYRSPNNKNILTVRGPFKTREKKHVSNLVITVVVSITVPLILLCAAIIAYLYIKHQRNTTIFLRRINSLKRIRRPPPPPSRNDSTASEINPYACFKPFKIAEIGSDEESDFSVSVDNISANNYSEVLLRRFREPDDYLQFAEKLRHSHIEKIADDSVTATHLDADINDSEGYMRMTSSTTHLRPPQPQPRHPKVKPRSKTFTGAQQQGNRRSAKCKSMYIVMDDPFGLGLSTHDINKAKLNNKYRRNRLDDEASERFALPRIHHSADDINKLYNIL